MTSSWRISRRTVLRGLGATIALPLLEAMVPPALADERKLAPRRMAFVYVPNGKHMPDWTPASDGEDFELPYILEPLAAHQKDLLVLSGLAQDHARPHGDGPGDHARALATFLTGQQARKTHGDDIQVGVSVDQVAARRIGQLTRLPSLELGCDRGPQAGNCDSGYSCSYSTNISWRTESTPQAKEINPKLVFDRLFSTDNAAAARSKRYEGNILDLVREDAGDLSRKLGGKDRRKLDEYLTAVREVEQRIGSRGDGMPKPPSDFPRPTGIPTDYAEHIRLMFDLMTLAFASDLTRVVTFVVANEGSNRSYPFLGVSGGHHELSHHGGNREKQAQIREINRFHVTQFAYFLSKLKSTFDGEHSLLDNSMVLYGSGIGDGDRHNHDNLPILLAGSAGGTIRAGRHARYAGETPLNNLFLSMLDRMDSSVESLGDSTGRLEGLA